MNKVSISAFLIFGIFIFFVSVMIPQLTNAQEDVNKINQYQREALKLFSNPQIQQLQQEQGTINDDTTLKSIILQKLQENQQQTNDNDNQNVNAATNDRDVNAQSQQQLQQQQIETEDQNLKALELFFNTDIQQQELQKQPSEDNN